MTEQKILRAPSECANVQPPVTPPNSLQEEFYSLLKQPGTVQKDVISGYGYPVRYDSAAKTVIGADGRRMIAMFSPVDQSRGTELELSTLDNGKVQERLVGAKDAAARWKIDTEAIAADLQNYGPQAGGMGKNEFRPGFRAESSAAIKLTGEPLTQNTSSMTWTEARSVGELNVEAFWRRSTNSVFSQRGTLSDLNGSRVTAFDYTFNPDGSATSCTRNSGLGVPKPDTLEWSLKSR